jgi:uncharacterized membrane protein
MMQAEVAHQDRETSLYVLILTLVLMICALAGCDVYSSRRLSALWSNGSRASAKQRGRRRYFCSSKRW